MSAGQSPLDAALHAERHEANARDVDCWACEALRSPAIRALQQRVREAEAAASHMHAVLKRAVPDEATELALWRDHWREQLDDAGGAS